MDEILCVRCQKLKPITEFHKQQSTKKKVRSICKQCVHKEYLKIRENRLEQATHYRMLNKKKIKEDRDKHKEEHKTYMQQYRTDKQQQLVEYGIRYRAENPYKCWAANAFNNHKRWGFQMEITCKEIEEMGKNAKNCGYCGVELNWGKKDGKPLLNSPSLDRRDNSRILTKKNLVVVCYQCNCGKNHGTLEEYVTHCRRVVEKFGKMKTKGEKDDVQKV